MYVIFVVSGGAVCVGTDSGQWPPHVPRSPQLRGRGSGGAQDPSGGSVRLEPERHRVIRTQRSTAGVL